MRSSHFYTTFSIWVSVRLNLYGSPCRTKEEVTRLRKIPHIVLRKMVALWLLIRGKGNRIEEIFSKLFEEILCLVHRILGRGGKVGEKGNISTFNFRKWWQDWGKCFEENVTLVLLIWGRDDRIEDIFPKYFEENGSFSTLDLKRWWQDWGKFLKLFWENCSF